MKSKVWFITGASKGLGLSLVKRLLQEGYRVAATSRNLKDLITAVGPATDSFLPLQVDLINDKSVEQAITATITQFSVIDVVVNNAGYGQNGAVEVLNDDIVRQNFDVNVFAVFNVIRKVMPYMRKNRSGQIYNIASIVGFKGDYPGWSCYGASKFAVAGLTEGLSAEVKSFGVHATVVYPGAFRTEFLAPGSLVLAGDQIPEYREAQQSLDLHLNELAGKQEGDPEKAAIALIKVAETQNPPLHLFLGNDSFKFARDKIKAVEQDLQQWEEVSKSTGFAQ
jgi:NAD(P)-dependent dehydrogenase (short-subunit alcohol dehydrogenase family)